MVKAVRRVSDHRSELLEQQPKNFLALGFGPAQALGGVMEDGAGGAAVEAAPGLVIEIVGRDFGGQGERRRCAVVGCRKTSLPLSPPPEGEGA